LVALDPEDLPLLEFRPWARTEEDAVMNASPDQGLDCAAVATSLTGELSPAAVSMLTIYLLELPIVNALLAYANVHSAGQDSHHPKDVSPRGFV
jgi:hypothetical protein